MSNELLVIIIPGIIGLIIFLTRSREGQKQALFDATVKRNQQLFDAALLTVSELTTKTIAMSVENARLTALDTVSQRDIAGLQRQISKQDERLTKQDGELTSLRTASDIERQQFNQHSIDFQKRIDADAIIIKGLQQSVDRLTDEVKDLKNQVKELREERDKLQQDASAAKGAVAA